MSHRFQIKCDWVEPNGLNQEIANTSASLRIFLNGNSLTSVANSRSNSISNQVVLAAYPLAQWIVSSWWRILWECPPPANRPTAWRMSHEMAAAGHGYVWPPIVFEPDGEAVRISIKHSDKCHIEPIRYITDAEGWVYRDELKGVLSDFVAIVCDRLSDLDLRSNDLCFAWDELREEMMDPALSRFRRKEAMLGFDAGEAPDDLVDLFLQLEGEYGQVASDELAYASVGDSVQEKLNQIIMASEEGAVKGRFEVGGFTPDVGHESPWITGYSLADKLRVRLSNESQPLDDKSLAALLGVSPNILKSQKSQAVPAGVVRKTGFDDVSIAFRKGGSEARRFEAARFLCEHISSSPQERILIESDTYSRRQQVQRAFAAEFLCPIRGLTEFLDGDYSSSARDDAAEYFKVDERVVRRQLINFRPEGLPFLEL